MTRAAERPPAVNIEPDDHWDHTEGDSPDGATQQALNLAHRAADKFPELAERYRSFAGPVAIVSGALVALAGVAVARRMRRGQREDEILDQITSAEIENAATANSRHTRIWRMLRRIAKRRSENGDGATTID